MTQRLSQNIKKYLLKVSHNMGSKLLWIRSKSFLCYFLEMRMQHSNSNALKWRKSTVQCTVQYTEVRFASFLSGGFITAIVLNPPESELAKRTSVQWFDCTECIAQTTVSAYVFIQNAISECFWPCYVTCAILSIKLGSGPWRKSS